MGKSIFFGRTYHYHTARDGVHTIGVMQGLGGDIWIVGYQKPHGSRKRIVTPRLPPTNKPDHLQDLLDEWAKDQRLQEVFL